jgi:hypothetical protein
MDVFDTECPHEVVSNLGREAVVKGAVSEVSGNGWLDKVGAIKNVSQVEVYGDISVTAEINVL